MVKAKTIAGRYSVKINKGMKIRPHKTAFVYFNLISSAKPPLPR